MRKAPGIILGGLGEFRLGEKETESKKHGNVNIPSDHMERVMAPWLCQLILVKRYRFYS